MYARTLARAPVLITPISGEKRRTADGGEKYNVLKQQVQSFKVHTLTENFIPALARFHLRG
jgi:hypothetical protein